MYHLVSIYMGEVVWISFYWWFLIITNTALLSENMGLYDIESLNLLRLPLWPRVIKLWQCSICAWKKCVSSIWQVQEPKCYPLELVCFKCFGVFFQIWRALISYNFGSALSVSFWEICFKISCCDYRFVHFPI